MDKEDIKALNRARVTAGWSYLGAIVPLVGWILGAISLSNLGSIDTPDTSKAKKRVAAVKKLAVGGIVLSTVIALLYGGLTAWNIQTNNKQQQQAALAKANADEQTCEQQIIQTNNKVFALNAKYPSGNALSGFDNSSNPSDCKKGADVALSKAKTSYESAVTSAQQRCLAAANDSYNSYLKINSVSTTTGADGQPVYRMPQANWDYINKVLQQDKDNCNQQFPTT